MSDPVAPTGWSPVRRVTFRFLFVYLVLYSAPFPVNTVPGVAALFDWYEAGSERLMVWFGSSVLGIEQNLEPFPTGSGDTTRAYVQLALNATIALLATALWSALVRGRCTAHPRLDDLLRTFTRYVLAVTVIGYGTAKWFDGQFRAIDGLSLYTTWGDTSPMGVVWKSMGASMTYTAITGVVECAAVLLFWRRTTALGALLTVIAMTQVVLLNFCYDVPVKQYSAHLLFMAWWLLLPHLPALAAVLLQREVPPAPPLRLPAPAWRRWPRLVLKVLFVGWLLHRSIDGVLQRRERQEEAPPSVLYEVTSFRRDGVEVPPLRTDATCWWVLWRRDSLVTLLMADGTTRLGHAAHWDAATDTLTIVRQAGANRSAPPNVLRGTTRHGPDGETWTLVGTYAGAVIEAVLRRRDPDSFQVRSRPFRWIQEFPYNR